MNKPNASPRIPRISGLENYADYGKGRKAYTYIHTYTCYTSYKFYRKIRLRERASMGSLRPTSQALELAFVIVV